MQDKIQEIIGLVETYGEACENYGKHRKVDAYQATENYIHLIEAALLKLVDAQIRMGECVGCGHLYMEPFPSQCDCLNNTENKYIPWVASRDHGITNTSEKQ